MKCAFLDLDHTVIKTSYRQYLIGKPAELIARKLDITHEKAVHLLRGKVREIMREKILSEEYQHAFDWDTVLPEAMSRLGIRVSEFNALALLLEAVKSGATSVYEDSVRTIRVLKRDHRVYAMTGGLSKYQDIILRELGIYDLFDAVLTTDRLGYLKVRPEAFRVAIEKCGCDQAFHTGDSPSHDVAGAKQAGLPAFLMVREWIYLKPYDPLTRVGVALQEGLLQKKMREDILYGYIPEDLMMPDAIIVELKELIPLVRELNY